MHLAAEDRDGAICDTEALGNMHEITGETLHSFDTIFVAYMITSEVVGKDSCNITRAKQAALCSPQDQRDLTLNFKGQILREKKSILRLPFFQFQLQSWLNPYFARHYSPAIPQQPLYECLLFEGSWTQIHHPTLPGIAL